jgi:Right handed beta helix region/FG-GAP repeat
LEVGREIDGDCAWNRARAICASGDWRASGRLALASNLQERLCMRTASSKSRGRATGRDRTCRPRLEALEARALFTGFPDFSIGAPTLTSLWVDPVHGSDSNAGTSPTLAVQTVSAAWNAASDLSSTGYQINLLPGIYPYDNNHFNYFADRAGTYAHPIIIQAASGNGSVTIQGGLNIANSSYLYLIGLNVSDLPNGDRWGNNVFHLDGCDHVLMRGLTISGPSHAANPDNFDIQEVVKANQCEYLYMENCDISGTYQTGVDFVSAQHGHIFQCTIHDTGDWGMYLKGGSAYFDIEGNTFFDTRLGFQAGEGSSFEVMRAPFLHYETYDIKFTNNLLHDVPGTAVSVAGSYNTLIANNTLYHVAYFTDEASGGVSGFSPMTFVHGSRDCDPTNEIPNASDVCRLYVAAGGWGPTSPADDGEYIPNKNIFVYDNIIDNAGPSQSRYSHFVVADPVIPPAGSNIPSPSRADDGLVIRGNLIWNGPADLPLGVDDPTGSLAANNTINTVEPQLVDPLHGNYRPLAGGNVDRLVAVPIPNFTWSDAPSRPAVPVGTLTNALTYEFTGALRAGTGSPGAFLTSTIPLPVHTAVRGDFDGDGKTDLAVYGPYGPGGSERIQVNKSGGGVINQPLGGPLDHFITGDFDGDGKTDLAVYGPYGPGGSERIQISFSGGGFVSQPLGGPLDHFISGDFDGDGQTDLAVYGPYGPGGSERIAVALSGGGVINRPFGGPRDTFISGDFDGDHKTDLAVYGPYGPGGAGRIAVLLSGGGVINRPFGGPHDTFITGDFDGDGKADLAVYGPYGPGGVGRIAVLESGGGVINRPFGGPLDHFVSGDFDGDGKTDLGVYGPYGAGGSERVAVLLSGGGVINQPFGGRLDTLLPAPIGGPSIVANLAHVDGFASALVSILPPEAEPKSLAGSHPHRLVRS